ncbi:hypothetical protein [Emcibacter sp.]|uniref:hypothetical protein n=1 Tax=Emcibacter sp. TaxID=1979954 RepID=UPI002AA961CB|nr:hypothetical protein [Emcibacter sp.]
MMEPDDSPFDLADYLDMVQRDRIDTIDCLKFLLEEARKSDMISVVELLERAIPEVEAAFADES